MMLRSLPMRIYSACATLYVLLRHPRLDGGMRHFIRQRLLSRGYQLRFWWPDHVARRPYRTISWESEFSPELKFVLPYAYWHHLNGTLSKTISSKDTRAFYFFSTDHEERFEKRKWNDFDFPLDIPNSEDHNLRYDYSKWAPVPWKEHFSNTHFVHAKPLVVIANRYNTEWGGAPVSFFGSADLEALISLLLPRFQVIYNRPPAASITNDESVVLDLDEKRMIREKFPEAILLEDLLDHPDAKPENFNHLQLMVYANCDRFISIHGGTATLASCFGGTNIILSKQGHEHFFGEFKSIYPRLSGARIIACSEMDEVLANAQHHFIDAPGA